ncbi:YidC/Oxa1 family membrane protein insertase [Caulobacter ginsengisoli]|uniref:Membrane protein insertase YidC n=1 Tax=Caulobacter ginsengisoli TaxID=400775 RepID=A0ABU0IWN5_9CAUL|nr:membrane protein insertase YidC [Caulobacter ginsengisoli]MDQ0466400.1 YidC/Oxa1 family membrane protein insertase [Caulobacter ginsengisoli]
MQDETRNWIIFIAIAVVVLIGYDVFVMGPQTRLREAEAQKAAVAQKAQAAQAAKGPQATAPVVIKTRAEALAQSPRIAIVTEPNIDTAKGGTLTGSLSLTGGRIDDLFLKGYRKTLNSPDLVELLRPLGADNSWFAEFGWSGVPGAPSGLTVWQKQSGDVLSPGKPVVLTYRSPEGLLFTRTISLDHRYMFTIHDVVANYGAAPQTLTPYSKVERQGLPADLEKAGSGTHQGAIGTFGDGKHYETATLRYFKPWQTAQTKEDADKLEHQSTGGWTGLTDKYWLTALAPDQKEPITSRFAYSKTLTGVDVYNTTLIGRARLLPPGRQIEETTSFFAGAKTLKDLETYQKNWRLPRFTFAVDWGRLFFLTQPFFQVLDYLFHLVKNFGVAILIMTVLVRLALFPLANKSYESMSKMRKLQEPMNAIKEKYKDDPAKQQQETMALYQREKVNPMVGCLPILVQIPVFLAFFKVLSTTIEMRHAPFYGWINDLSARDSTTVLNLFGLIPWDPAATPLIGGFLDGPLHLGVLALLYGFTMWLTTAMNPPAPDPMQQRMFQLMPLIFTFIMTGYPVGLLLYWTWSNVLSILQQYVIMHRLKVDNPIDDFIARIRGRSEAAPG